MAATRPSAPPDCRHLPPAARFTAAPIPPSLGLTASSSSAEAKAARSARS